MDEEVTTSFWISFFVEAGIPPAAAANYAIIFTDNRIQKHMLLDLNKEYLKDMGVNILGDIIAILKHSKRYHEKVAREKVLAIDKETSVIKATKHLNEMLLKDDVPKKTNSDIQQPIIQLKAVSRPSPPKKLKTAKSEGAKKVEEEPEWIEEVEDCVELKRKVLPPKLVTKTAAPTTSAVKVVKKSSVFDRLGESSVTSTTPEIQDSPTKVSTNAAIVTKSSQSSVFNRLGGIQEKKDLSLAVKPVTRTLPVTMGKQVSTPLVKLIDAKTTDVSDASKPFLRMDIENSASKQSARQRLGLDKPSNKIGVVSSKATSKTPIRTTISTSQGSIQKRLVRPPQAVTPPTKRNSSGVKDRLGSVAVVKGNKTSTSPSVFNRLGVTRKET